MAPSFDCAFSSLLCEEDNFSIIDDYFGGVREFGAKAWNHRFYRNSNQNRVFDGVGLPSEECVALMVEKEHRHLPSADYLKRLQSGDLDPAARQEAIDFIRKVRAHFSFGPLCEYLSVNYLDRFLSAYELPKGKGWTMQLLAVACVSLAAKMEETEVPLLLDLQVRECKFVFEATAIQRMEVLVLSTLSWRMQAITPFSFIDYFLYKFHDDKIPPRSSVLRSIQLISTTITGIDLLEFKPSEIAAAVAIKTTTVDTEKAMSFLTEHAQKERVIKCVGLMREMSLVGATPVPSVPQSPIGVLDAASLSYKGDDTSPDTKRRKLNRPCEMEL
ncbi:Cyclin-D4-1 [Hibiscus syriacus]|uniref:Cyclin-D4-1 n=1 Tax=Hibiscus syriacus TaxID=106335 RepID=A0A6A2WIQ8_HIBSY|nr:cyclin-D4-1-like [Hibiscus syriacus]KAE8659252.1 Cyclin-D4-1 [Hibiscus syriacus]